MKRLLFLLLFLPNLFLAQEKSKDSLLLALKSAKDDTVKCNVLNALIDNTKGSDKKEYIDQLKVLSESGLKKNTPYNYFFINSLGFCYFRTGIFFSDQSDHKNAIDNFQKAIPIYEKTKNKLQIGKLYINISRAYSIQSELNKALEYEYKAKKVFEDLGDTVMVRRIINGIGLTYKDLANYPMALDYMFQALKLSQVLHDTSSIGRSQNNLGLIYQDMGNLSEALSYYNLSLKNCEKVGDKYLLGRLINNIGLVYEEKGILDTALIYYIKSLEKSEIVNDKYMMGITLGNIGFIYSEKNNSALAIDYFNRGLKLSQELGDQGNMGRIYGNLGRLYSNLGDFKLAEDYLKKGLYITTDLGINNLAKFQHFYLSHLYEKTNKPEKALLHYKKYVELKDSIFSKENTRKFMYSEMNNEFETKKAVEKAKHQIELENQKALADEKNRKQNAIILSVGIGLVLVIIFSIYVLKSLRTTNKQKQIIELKNEETEKQKLIIEEKHKEITDSINYAQRIQHSLLATTDLFEENLPSYFILFQPKDIVSGDFYWASKLNNGNFALVTGDSTGHGVPGAIMSILNISCLKEAIKEGLIHPSEIFNRTRSLIVEILANDGSVEGGKDGMDASILSFDFKTKKITYTAANNPVWVIRNKEMIVLPHDKMPVGKHEKDSVSFSQNDFNFQNGDMIYTLTDGIADQFGGPKGKKFMYKRLKELLISISHQSMQEQQELITQELNAWMGNLEQVDDVTLIGIRV